MRRLEIIFVVSILALATGLATAQQRVVVRLANSAAPVALLRFGSRPAVSDALVRGKALDAVQSTAQQTLLEHLSRYVVIELPPDVDIAKIALIDGVEEVRPLQRIRLHEESLTNDSLGDRQFALHRIGARNAWERATGKGVVVGIIDTGIDWTHEDLVGALSITAAEDVNGNRRFDAWSSQDTIGGVAGDLNGVDDDGNGIIDDVIGIDLVDQTVRNLGDDRDYDPVPFDEQGHGTLVGGVIAATPNNEKGIAGLAYDARLRIVRAFDATGNAEEDDIASAIIYLALQGVDVINMSFGDGVDSPLMCDAVRFAHERGCLLVASVGNTGTTSRQFPAGYDNVIAVASTNDENRRSPFSSTGSLVALSAPGQAIVTTSVGSRYRTVNGTSFAAPYVAATIAMMRQRFPSMSTSDVRATLQQRTLDLGQRGWDELFGAGLLQADAALADGPWSRVEITSPANEIEIDREASAEIDVMGSSMLASFAGYELAWGEGLSPRLWSTVVSSQTAVRDGKLGRVIVPASDSQVVTLRLRVQSSDGRHLDVFRRLRVVGQESFVIRSVEIVPAWRSDRRTSVISVRTSRACECELTPVSSDWPLVQSLRRARRHSLIMPDTSILNEPHPVRLRCRPFRGEARDTVVILNSHSQGAGADAHWRPVGAASWSGYVLNDVRDIYRDGRATVVMNDLSRGSFGGLVTRQFVDGAWLTRDSVPDVYIPRGIGDANGNGRFDLLVHSVGKLVLCEQREPNGSPMGTVIFADTSGSLNGAGMADIDGDGREELIALSDDECQVFTFKGTAFRLLGSITNPTPPEPGNAINRVDEISVACGDFDGDGRMEIAFGDTDGDLIIGEWQGTRFDVTYTLTLPGAGGSGFVASGDVTGDGRPDVLFGVPDSSDPDSNGDYGRSLWTYTLVSSATENAYDIAWQDRVAGVRYGVGFRNGVAVGDLDDEAGEEIIIGAFPRLYVFGRDDSDTGASIICKRFIADVASPRFLIHDLDGNGRNELGYGITIPELGVMTSFAFTEALPVELRAPSALRARWVDDELRLDWLSREPSLSIIEQAEPSGPFAVVDTTTGSSFTVPLNDFTLPALRFRIRALNPSSGKVSPPSNTITVFRPDSTSRFVLERDSVFESELRDGLKIRLISSADLDLRALTTSVAELRDASGLRLGRATSVVPRSARDVIVAFFANEARDSIRISIRGLRDASGKGLATAEFVLRVLVDPRATSDVALTSVRVESLRQIHITFSEPIDLTAESVSNYRLTPAGRIISATRVADSEVRLQLDDSEPLQARGVPYSITATAITSQSGSRMTKGPGATLLFTVVAPDLVAVYTYPQPLRLGQHTVLTIGGLPASATVEVLDASFSPLAQLETSSGVGGIQWDLRLSAGRTLVPGLYYVRVTDPSSPGSDPVMRKFWVER